MEIETIIALLEAVGAKDFLINAFKMSPRKQWTKQEIIEFVADANAQEDEYDAKFTTEDE